VLVDLTFFKQGLDKGVLLDVHLSTLDNCNFKDCVSFTSNDQVNYFVFYFRSVVVPHRIFLSIAANISMCYVSHSLVPCMNDCIFEDSLEVLQVDAVISWASLCSEVFVFIQKEVHLTLTDLRF
jgi:hypothetical protein